MTEREYEEEVARLHSFALQVSDRLFLAAEVLSILAERKKSRVKPGSESVEQWLQSTRSVAYSDH